MNPDRSKCGLEATQDEEFVRLFSAHRRRLFLYIGTMLPHWDDAEEVLQQTSIVLRQKFGHYDPSRSFFTWASAIAYRNVLNFRKLQRRRRFVFSEAVLEKLSDTQMEHNDLLENRRLALRGCVAKLAERDRQIIQCYYGESKKTAGEVAQELSRPINTIQSALARIRKSLRLCVDRAIAREFRK